MSLNCQLHVHVHVSTAHVYCLIHVYVSPVPSTTSTIIVLLCFRDMGLDLYRKHIMSNGTVKRRTVEGLLLLIEKERYRN